MNGFETILSDICFVVQEQWQKKGEGHAALSVSTDWHITTKVHMISASIHITVHLSAWTVNFCADRPFVVWL
jgi:hypothetical protein